MSACTFYESYYWEGRTCVRAFQLTQVCVQEWLKKLQRLYTR